MSRDWFEGWTGQYRRMLRWRDRTTEAIRGGDADTIYDFTYAFFQSCYHLRDWLRADGAASKSELDDLFASSIELRLCRDICNATKHLQYDHPSLDPRPRIGREWDPSSKTWHGWYLYSDERRSITDLAHGCIAIWDKFLTSKGLASAGPAA
jgi:hypothetical protein